MLNLTLVFVNVFMTWAIISGNLYLYRSFGSLFYRCVYGCMFCVLLFKSVSYVFFYEITNRRSYMQSILFHC